MRDWRQLAELSRGARVPYVETILAGLQLTKPGRIAASFARLLELPIFVVAADRVIRAISAAGSPERAMLALEDAIETLEQTRGDASPLLIDPILKLFVELAGASGRAARLLSRDPTLAIEFGARFTTHESSARPDYQAALARILNAADNDTELFDRLIRRYRNRQVLRIALRELREGDVRETSAELADLASAAVEAALLHHRPLLEAQLGAPDPACAHSVFGMGKLGGRELNFSSDIDVMYFYEHDEGRAGELELHRFFVELFERVTATLARITDHGFVFRVDLDLRPEGRSGAIANSVAGAERYYETWGRTWERAAWIKGRPIAGDRALGERVLSSMRPFVWRKSFDLEAIEEIFDMKVKIDEARARATRSAMNRGIDLKLGKGGIREIEFFAQSHQLLHGGRNVHLRSPNTLEALAQLEAAGHVSRKTRELLTDAYLLLRRIEHRVQIVEEQQTHHVPEDAEAAQAIARSLGIHTAETLREVIARSMHGVHEVFTQLLGSAQEEETRAPEVEVLLDRAAPEDERLSVLASFGARDPHSALANFERAARHPRSPFHPHADEAAASIGRRLLAECCASPSVDRALKHLPDLIRSLISHASYLEGLERPTLRRGVARVLGASDLLARILVASPALLPQVLLAETRGASGELDPAADVEGALSVLRAIKQEETLRTAIDDLAGALETVQVNERLTALAERLIKAALELAEKEMYARYGTPKRGAMVIIGGGTLGAHEMGYRSEVDLWFLYEGEGETTGGERPPISVSELYTRIAQRLLSFLSMRTAHGDLYPTDMRLRPSGNQGALVTSLSNFEQYHRKTAQLWERQALVRARAIAGAPALIERADAAIEAAAYDAPGPPDAKSRIHEMRVRMDEERSVRRRPGPSIDLELGPGGIVEAEFLVQYLLITHGREHVSLRTTSTRRAIGALAQAGLLEKKTADRVLRAYDHLRRLQNWLRIAHDEMIDHVDLSDEVLRPLALAIGYAGDSAQALLRRDLLADTAAIHQSYAAVVGG